jgi:hypothetical protein
MSAFKVLAALALATCIALIAATAARTGNRGNMRQASTCTPAAQTPWVYTSSKTGYSIGTTTGTCPQPGDPDNPYYWDQQLRNLAGNPLDEISGYASGEPYFTGNTVNCAGANVHTHLYLNVGGQGESDESGNNSNCTY